MDVISSQFYIDSDVYPINYYEIAFFVLSTITWLNIYECYHFIIKPNQTRFFFVFFKYLVDSVEFQEISTRD